MARVPSQASCTVTPKASGLDSVCVSPKRMVPEDNTSPLQRMACLGAIPDDAQRVIQSWRLLRGRAVTFFACQYWSELMTPQWEND